MIKQEGFSHIKTERQGTGYLIFTLGEEEYGIDILKVQEICGYHHVTRIANMPDFIKGITHLRGVIIPIIDLRIKFSQSDVIYDHSTVVIIVMLSKRIIGIVVDAVSDVLTLMPEQICPPPEMSSILSAEYLMGLGMLEQRMLILVNIEKLLNSQEMALIQDIDG